MESVRMKRLVAIVFILATVMSPYVVTSSAYEHKDISDLISRNYGSIDHIHRAQDTQRWIFLLRDAHFNVGAQRNIAAILSQLRDHNQLDAIYLEGAAGNLDISLLARYPHDMTLREVSDFLLKKSHINGVEYFAATSNSHIVPEGIEDADAYIDNLTYLKQALANKDEYRAITDQILEFVEHGKKSVLSLELLEFEHLRQQYTTNELSLAGYCTSLQAPRKSTSDAYPNIRLLLESGRLLEQISDADLSGDETRALSYLTGRIDETVLQHLFAQRISSHIDTNNVYEFYKTLIEELNRCGVTDKQFPDLYAYFTAVSLQNKIDFIELDCERNRLEQDYIERFAQSEAERSLYTLERRAVLLQQFFDLTLNAKEARRMLDHHADYSSATFARLIHDIDSSLSPESVGVNARLDNARIEVSAFYDLALQRDSILARNALVKMNRTGAQYAVVFTGGFHTPGMIGYLSEHNVNIAVIKPVIPSSDIASQSAGYSESFISTRTKLESFINRVINAIAIPRWLSFVPLGISENEKNIKMLETATYLMSLHAEHIIRGDRHKASPEIIETVNAALQSLNIDRLKKIQISAIRRFPQYREYELQINGESLFFYFTDNNPDFVWKTVTDDIQSILADTDVFTGTLFAAIADTPVKMVAAPVETQDTLMTDDFVEWARAQSMASAEKTTVDMPAPAVITVTRDAGQLVVSLVALDNLTRDKNVVYQDRLPADGLSVDFIARLTQSIRATFGSSLNIAPKTVVINPFTDTSGAVDVSDRAQFEKQANPLLRPTKNRYDKEESFSDFPFETTSAEKQTLSDTQLVEKFIRHVKRQASYSTVISLAKKATNKRLLTILASSEFQAAVMETFGNKIRAGQLTYNIIVRNLLNNKNTPADALRNILQNDTFDPMIMQAPFAAKYATNPLNLIATHRSADSDVLDLLAGRVIGSLAKPQGLLSGLLSAVNRYIPVYRLMNNPLTRVFARYNLMPSFTKSFLEKTFARMTALSVIEHSKVAIDTVEKLYEDTNDLDIALAISRSPYPHLVADHPDEHVRRLVMRNPHTPIEKLIEYSKDTDSSQIRALIAHKLTQNQPFNEETIKTVSAFDDVNILAALLTALHSPDFSAQNPDLANQQIPAVWDSLAIMIPGLSKRDLLSLTESLLSIQTPAPSVRGAIDETLRDLGLQYPEIAAMTAGSKNSVNPKTVEVLIQTYAQEQKINLDVIVPLAARADLTLHTAQMLEKINNKLVIQTLLANDRIAPVFSDADLQKINETQIPLRIAEAELLAYIDEKANDIVYLRQMAKKSTLTPNALLKLHYTGDPQIYAEFAARPDLPKGIAEIISHSSHPIAMALLVLNPATPPHVVQNVAKWALDNKGRLFDGMTIGQIDYFLKRFPNLSMKDSLLSLLAHNSAILMSDEVINSYTRRGLSQPICMLISQFAIETNIASQAGNTEQAFIKMAPYLFKGIRMWETFDEQRFFTQLADAGLNVLHADLAPVGSLIHFANAAYRYARSAEVRYPERAEHAMRLARQIYEYASTKKNNPTATLALTELDVTGRVPDELLDIHNILHVMALDLHNAQPFTANAAGQLKRFHRIPYETSSYETRLLGTLATLLLRDAVRQRLISSDNALAILNDFLESGVSAQTWESAKIELLHRIVSASNLTAQKKEDLLIQHPDFMEFFIRHGSRGMMNYNRFRRFYDNLIIENMPEYLHADMARAIWFELMDVTSNQLFVDPHYVTHLKLIRSNGEVEIGKDSFKISFPVIDLSDIAPGDSTILAEIGHLIDFALFRDSSLWSNVYYSPFGEFQDRSAMQYMPHQLNDSILSNPMIELYNQYDNQLIGLFEAFARKARAENKPVATYLRGIYFGFEPQGLTQQALSSDTYKILYESPDISQLSPIEKRVVGEYLLYAAQSDPEAAPLIEPVKDTRRQLDELPWNIRAFFEGGTYLSTYGSAYPQLSPPMQPVFGPGSYAMLDQFEVHVGGEWLSYYFRSHVRELLRNGSLTAESLPQFYRSAIYYLRTVVYKDGRPDGKKVVEVINNLTPQTMFADIRNRTVTGQIVTSAKDPVSGKAWIAAPEKVVFNAFARVLDQLFFADAISFKQLALIGRYFVKSVYPAYRKSQIDAAQDASRSPEVLESFTDFLFTKTNGIFESYTELKNQIELLLSQQYDEVLQQTPEPADEQPLDEILQAGTDDPAVDALFDSMKMSTDTLIEKSHVIIDFDNVFHLGNPVEQRELLMAFGLMFNTGFAGGSDSRTVERQARRLIFYSPSLTQGQMAAILSTVHIDPNMFTFAGTDAVDINQLGLKQYLLLNHTVSLPNTVFISTPASGRMKDLFAADGSIVYDMGDSADFQSFGSNLQTLFDLLLHNTVPTNLSVISVSPVRDANLAATISANNTVPVGQLIASSQSGNLDYAGLSGLVVTMPAGRTTTPKPAATLIQATRQRLFDEAL